MRHIEVVCAQAAQSQVPPQPPGPLIDWSWDNAPNQLRDGRIPEESMIRERTALPAYRYRMLLPQVVLPHVITVILGVLLAFLAYRGRLSAWGDRS
jgi:hypothetical protein